MFSIQYPSLKIHFTAVLRGSRGKDLFESVVAGGVWGTISIFSKVFMCSAKIMQQRRLMWHGVIGCSPEKQWKYNFRTTEVERMAPGNFLSGTALDINFIATQCERLQGKCQAHCVTCLRPAGFLKRQWQRCEFLQVPALCLKGCNSGKQKTEHACKEKTCMA